MNSDFQTRLLSFYTTLARHFAYEPHWWPIFSPNTQFEVMVGAVLVQQTRWEAVEGAIRRLIDRGWLSPKAMAAADTAELAALIRPCAFHSQKAPGLQAICRYLLSRYDGDTVALFAQERWALRAELLALPRVGRETADTMMLYAGQHPVFIVDAYARRLFQRVGVLPNFDFLQTPYDQVQACVEQELAAAALPSGQNHHSFYWNFHALITEACIHHCLTRPRCDLAGLRRMFVDPRKCAEHCLECGGCPLRAMCRAYQSSANEHG